MALRGRPSHRVVAGVRKQAGAVSRLGRQLSVRGTGAGIYRSSDHGNSWSNQGPGLTDTNVTSLAVSGSTIFAGTTTHIVDSAYGDAGLYFAGMFGGGVFRSSDYGASWTEVNTGFPSQQTRRGMYCDMDVQALAFPAEPSSWIKRRRSVEKSVGRHDNVC